MRLLIAMVQAPIIVGIGSGIRREGVGSLCSPPVVVLGAISFIAIGYVVASFVRTEEAANGVTGGPVPDDVPLGGVLPDRFMPASCRSGLLPLTYLGDALRQVMVNGAAFAPLPVASRSSAAGSSSVSRYRPATSAGQ